MTCAFFGGKRSMTGALSMSIQSSGDKTEIPFSGRFVFLPFFAVSFFSTTATCSTRSSRGNNVSKSSSSSSSSSTIVNAGLVIFFTLDAGAFFSVGGATCGSDNFTVSFVTTLFNFLDSNCWDNSVMSKSLFFLRSSIKVML